MKKFLKNKKGFTLIELLAVIVVLAIILVIATGSVLNVIENTRISAFNSTYNIVIKTIKDNVTMENMGLQSNNITCSSDPSDSDNCYDKYEISKDDYELEVTGDSTNGYTVVLGGKGKFENIELKNDTNVGGELVEGNCALNGACAEVDNKPIIVAKIDATTANVSGIGEEISKKEDIIDKLEAIKKYPSFAKNQEDGNLKIIGEGSIFAVFFPQSYFDKVNDEYGEIARTTNDERSYIILVNDSYLQANYSYKQLNVNEKKSYESPELCYSSNNEYYKASMENGNCIIERLRGGDEATLVYYKKTGGWGFYTIYH